MVWVTLEKEKKILPCNWKYLHFKVNGTVEMESPSTKLKTGRLSIPVNRACSKYGNLHHASIAVLFRKKHALWKLNCYCSLPALKDKTKAQPCKTQSFVSEPLPPILQPHFLPLFIHSRLFVFNWELSTYLNYTVFWSSILLSTHPIDNPAVQLFLWR